MKNVFSFTTGIPSLESYGLRTMTLKLKFRTPIIYYTFVKPQSKYIRIHTVETKKKKHQKIMEILFLWKLC